MKFRNSKTACILTFLHKKNLNTFLFFFREHRIDYNGFSKNPCFDEVLIFLSFLKDLWVQSLAEKKVDLN